VDSEVASEHRDERLAQVLQGGLAVGSEPLLGHDHPDRLAVGHQLQTVHARRVVAQAELRLLARAHLSDQVALGRVPSRELDPRSPADDAAPAVAPDQVLRPQRGAVGELDLDARLVLREARDLGPVPDGHTELGEPGGHDPLDLVLEDRQRVGMTRREVAHLQHAVAERHDPVKLAAAEEPVGHAALVEHLDRARVKPAGPRAGEPVVRSPLDDHGGDAGQRQLGRQHHPRRAGSGDDHVMLRCVLALL
jgi:hypothetical protein